jgi:hypothetical protein
MERFMARQKVLSVKRASHSSLLTLLFPLLLNVSGCSAQMTPATAPDQPPTAAISEPTVVATSTTAPVVAEEATAPVTAAPATEAIVAPTATTVEEPVAQQPASAPAPVNGNVYTNPKFNYTVVYPSHWWPSGITYANAFEVRNFDPQNPASVPEENRASVIFVDTVNENAAVTDAYLDSLLVGECVEELTIDGHRAVRIRRDLPGQPLGPGSARASGVEGVAGEEQLYRSISTYIANGSHLIAIESSAPVQANEVVFEEIISIEDSVKFSSPE